MRAFALLSLTKLLQNTHFVCVANGSEIGFQHCCQGDHFALLQNTSAYKASLLSSFRLLSFAMVHAPHLETKFGPLLCGSTRRLIFSMLTSLEM